MSKAGGESPHLDHRERRQAMAAAPLGPLVIHEIVRAQGEQELARSASGLAWSGLAAGGSMGFSFLIEGVIKGSLPDAPWNHLVASFGYAVGFLIVVLGQQQLFTETTLTALIPALTRRNVATFAATLRVWAIVLVANLAGTLVDGFLAARLKIFTPSTMSALASLSYDTMKEDFATTAFKAGMAGWVIGLMVWLLPAAGSAGSLIIVLLTYVVAVASLNHVVAGSAEAFFGVAAGQATFGAYLMHFLLPTLIGNTAGGTILVALLNHAPIAEHLDGEDGA